MYPPCEMMAKTFLPAVRGLVVHRLKKMGVGQPTIAKMVGVSQPAVSQILRKNEKSYTKSLNMIGLDEGEVGLLVETLCEELYHSPSRATAVLYSFWKSLLSEGRLCTYHRSLYPVLADCDICMNPAFETGLDEKRLDVLRRLDRCVRRLVATRSFSVLIPEVGTNLVYSLERAESLNDVAGVAGRVVAVGSEVRSVGRPAFGASRHLASVLLNARRRSKNIRSAINISNNPAVKKAIVKTGVEHTELPAETRMLTDEEIAESVAGFAAPAGLSAVMHGGGLGIEPATYVFGEDPESLVDYVIRLAALVLFADPA